MQPVIKQQLLMVRSKALQARVMEYRPLDEHSVPAFLSAEPALAERLGAPPWRVREVGDGNLNLVFLVEGQTGGLCVKQSLPYVRAAGPDWQLPLDRAFFEHEYYRMVGPYVPGLAPAIHHYDSTQFCCVMEMLSPHIILRRGLVAGHAYPQAITAVASYVARASFFTSHLALPFEAVADATALFAGNQSTLRITTDLVFADPYRTVARNRWTSPQLDEAAASCRADAALKRAVSELGYRFLTVKQALLHGDLHTGSVMVTQADTRVIDPEFALYGPIGFDLGAFLANLMLSHHAQFGLMPAGAAREAQQEWLVTAMGQFWNAFRAEFLALWRDAAGDAYPASLFEGVKGEVALAAIREAFLAEIFTDTIGFAAIKIIRRILGFAHVLDLEAIPDPDVRARLERACLAFARTVLLERGAFTRIEQWTDAVVRSGALLG